MALRCHPAALLRDTFPSPGSARTLRTAPGPACPGAGQPHRACSAVLRSAGALPSALRGPGQCPGAGDAYSLVIDLVHSPEHF